MMDLFLYFLNNWLQFFLEGLPLVITCVILYILKKSWITSIIIMTCYSIVMIVILYCARITNALTIMCFVLPCITSFLLILNTYLKK